MLITIFILLVDRFLLLLTLVWRIVLSKNLLKWPHKVVLFTFLNFWFGFSAWFRFSFGFSLDFCLDHWVYQCQSLGLCLSSECSCWFGLELWLILGGNSIYLADIKISSNAQQGKSHRAVYDWLSHFYCLYYNSITSTIYNKKSKSNEPLIG